MWRIASGRTMPRPAPAATAKAAIWKGRPRPTPPTMAATTAATASSPKASVVVMISATPSSAARTSQAIHDPIITPERPTTAGPRAANERGSPVPVSTVTPTARTPLLTDGAAIRFTGGYEGRPWVTPRRPGARGRRMQRGPEGHHGASPSDGPTPEGTTMTSVTEPSYSHGASAVPLLGETIGANLRRVAAAHPATGRRWWTCRTGRRWTYAELDADTDALARGLIAAGIAGRRPGRHLGAELRRVGAGPVRDREGRRDPGQHQPGLPHPRARLRPAPVRASGCWSARTSFKTSDYRAMVERGPGRAGAAGADRLPGIAGVGRARLGGRAAPPASRARWPRGRPAWPSTTRSTSSTPAGPPASPRARPCPTTTSSTTASSSARAAATPSRTGSASRCPSTTASAWCSATGLHHARRLHRHPGPGFEPAVTLRGGAGGAVHVPVRGADHVHRRARAAGFRRLRPVDACGPGSWPARPARSR